MNVAVILAVCVIGAVIVAALVNGNDAVAVIDAVSLAVANGIRRRSPEECAAHLDVMKIDELIEHELYGRGVDLLERTVAMLTKLIDS